MQNDMILYEWGLQDDYIKYKSQVTCNIWLCLIINWESSVKLDWIDHISQYGQLSGIAEIAIVLHVTENVSLIQ